jgi:hypothetical protein
MNHKNTRERKENAVTAQSHLLRARSKTPLNSVALSQCIIKKKKKEMPTNIRRLENREARSSPPGLSNE